MVLVFRCFFVVVVVVVVCLFICLSVCLFVYLFICSIVCCLFLLSSLTFFLSFFFLLLLLGASFLAHSHPENYYRDLTEVFSSFPSSPLSPLSISPFSSHHLLTLFFPLLSPFLFPLPKINKYIYINRKLLSLLFVKKSIKIYFEVFLDTLILKREGRVFLH